MNFPPSTLHYPRSAINTSPPAGVWQFWLTVFIFGGVFFLVTHDWNISQYEDFAPWSNSVEVQASGANVLKGAALGLIGLLGFVFLWEKDGRPLIWRNPLTLLLAIYFLWAGCSLTWSIDPAMTLRRLAVLSFCFVGAMGVARRLTGREIVLTAMIITSTYLLLGIVAEIAHANFRPWESGYRFSGTIHPNSQGVNLAILCLAALQLARTENTPAKRRWAICLGLAGFAFLFLTRSRTALAGFLAAAAVLGMIRLQASSKMLVIFGALGITSAALLFCSLGGIDIEDRFVSAAMLGRESESEALTGRLPVWEELLYYAGQRPWQGYGYESFWTPWHIEDVSEDVHWRFREAHNAYIDTVLSLGLVGAAALLSIAAFGIYRTAGSYRGGGDSCSGFTLGMLIFGLIGATMESGMAGINFITLITGCGLLHCVVWASPDTNTSINDSIIDGGRSPSTWHDAY
jgi:O-antigen ligase